MSSAFPRPLSDRERGLLDLLLAQEFPGAAALRVQRESVRVKGLWRNLGGLVLLEVCDAHAPKADVVQTVPVETKVRGADPPQEVLLFVKRGLLDSIELVTYAVREPVELPAVETVETPTVNGATAYPRLARRDG
jgi:hypothetical protein